MSGTTRSPQRIPVKQFSLFADNKVGRMHDMVTCLEDADVHILGVCTVDSTDSAIIRIVVDYWQQARNAFHGLGIPFVINDVVCVELETITGFSRVTATLMEAELNIHYIYPLLMRPNGRCGIVLRLDDNEMAETALKNKGITVLDHSDIAR